MNTVFIFGQNGEGLFQASQSVYSMVFEQVDGELNEMDYSTFSSNLSALLSPRSVR